MSYYKSSKKRSAPYKSTTVTKRAKPAYLKSEVKNSQVTATATFPTAGGVILLNGISTGTSINQRDALQIRLDHLDMTFRVNPNADFVAGAFRVFIVYDGSPNGVLPGFTDIFSNAGYTTAQRVENMWRFKILYEKTWGAGYASADGIGENYQLGWHKKLDLKNRMVQYVSTGTTIADIAKGALYLVIVGTTANEDLTYNLATRFRDY